MCLGLRPMWCIMVRAWSCLTYTYATLLSSVNTTEWGNWECMVKMHSNWKKPKESFCPCGLWINYCIPTLCLWPTIDTNVYVYRHCHVAYHVTSGVEFSMCDVSEQCFRFWSILDLGIFFSFSLGNIFLYGSLSLYLYLHLQVNCKKISIFTSNFSLSPSLCFHFFAQFFLLVELIE
jgi:hypothetical protein